MTEMLPVHTSSSLVGRSLRLQIYDVKDVNVVNYFN